MNRGLQNALLGAYRLVFARGLMRYAWGRRLFFAGYELYKNAFEAGPIDALRAHVPGGALVIDVGANVGFFTERFARWAGPKGRVVAIEPEAANFAELTRRLVRRGLAERVALHRAVADAKTGTAQLVVNADHPGDHRLGDGADIGVPVAAVALDDAVPRDRRVTLIKIDVQGAEQRVLAGAGAILARDRPALFVEIEPTGLARFGTGVDGLLAHLERAGYAPHALTRAGAVLCGRAGIDAAIARHGYIDLLFLAAA